MRGVRDFFFRYGTPLTAGLFIVSAVSGVALYFGWSPGLFHEMHEVLSLVLLLPFVLHLWRNWRPFLNYFRHKAMPIALVASLAAAAVFAYGASASGRSGGNPAMALVAAAQEAPLETLAPVLKLDGATAVKRLDDAGFGPVAPTDTLAAIAARSGHSAFELIAKLTAPAPEGGG